MSLNPGAPDPTVIGLLPPLRRIAVLVALVLTGAPTVFVIRALFVGGIEPDTTATRIIAVVIAVLFGALTLLFLANVPRVLTGRRIEIGSTGTAQRMVGSGFVVEWSEITAVRVSSGVRSTRSGRRTLVWLEWWPLSPPAPGHRRLAATVGDGPPPAAGPARLFGRPGSGDRYRLSLGPVAGALPALDAALSAWAGERHRPPAARALGRGEYV